MILLLAVLVSQWFFISTVNADVSWQSVFFNAGKPPAPKCSYVDRCLSSCWTKDIAEDVELGYVSSTERIELQEKVRDMFFFGYDNYMRYAFPMDELNPVFCSGRGSDRERPDNINVNDALGDYMLTLVDSLDTLAVMGDVVEFKSAVEKVIKGLSFSNTTVQVFESTIRIMGGLMSAHMIITHPDRVKLFGYDFRPDGYDDELLSLARELGVRLLPAFENTKTGICWPRVNLRHGVPANCSEETATAGAGSLLLEFGILSKLTGDPVYESSARRVVRELFKLKSPNTGLLGSIVNINTGQFTSLMSGVGASLDSLYEYLLKAHIAFSNSHDTEFADMYDTLISSVRRYLRIGRPRCNRGFGSTPLYINADMRTGDMANNWIDSLQAAFAAILVLNGEISEAICQHAAYAAIWRRFGVLPERYNFRMRLPEVRFYPLRPELAESTYFLYQATKNPYYLAVGRSIVNNLDDFCKAKCGYATVHDVDTMELEDRMESFFLAETCKYLYLLFDADHPLNREAERILFTTEGHIVPLGNWLHSAVDETLSTPKMKKRKRSPRRWIKFDLPTNASESVLASTFDTTGNASNVLPLKNLTTVGVSSRTCEAVNDLRHQLMPLDFRFHQQINVEIGVETT